MQTQNIVITRGQVGQIGNFSAWFGLLLFLLGSIWQGGITPLIIAFGVVGVVGFAVWGFATPNDFLGFFSGRQVQRGTLAVFTTFLLVGIVSVTYLIVKRQVIVSDITIDGRFTLDERTLDILQAVKRSPRPLQILGFYRAQDLIQREIDDQYWQLYESGSDGMIMRRYVDPVIEPAVAVPFQEGLAQGFYVYVGYANDDGTLDLSTATTVDNANNQEQAMSEAIARVLTAGNFKVYFERSLGTLDPIENTRSTMSNMNNVLRASGIITDRLSLEELAQSGGSIPRDASALILAQPQREPTAQEIAIIDAYVKNGGSLFIAADFSPREDNFMTANSPFNAWLWENYGIRMTDAVVVDTQTQGPSEFDVISAQVVAENDITTRLNLENQPQTSALFHFIRAIEVNPEPPVPNGSLVYASDLSWGETDISAIVERNQAIADINTDLRSPITLVAFAYNDQTNSKVILVGDGDFLTNSYTSAETQFYSQGNSTLFLDGVGWLTGFSQEVSFAPQAFSAMPVLFSGGEQLDYIAFFTIFFMPASMVAMASWVYFRRYRAS
jgi:hypothetical protein